MQIDLKTVAELLWERMETLFGDVLLGTDVPDVSATDMAAQRMAQASDALFGGQSPLSYGTEEAGLGMMGLRGGQGSEAKERAAVTQNIYLRESDPSPYKTARAIRRESEAMLRI